MGSLLPFTVRFPEVSGRPSFTSIHVVRLCFRKTVFFLANSVSHYFISGRRTRTEASSFNILERNVHLLGRFTLPILHRFLYQTN